MKKEPDCSDTLEGQARLEAKFELVHNKLELLDRVLGNYLPLRLVMIIIALILASTGLVKSLDWALGPLGPLK